MALSITTVGIIRNPNMAAAGMLTTAMNEICTTLDYTHPFSLHAAKIMGRSMESTETINVPNSVRPLYVRACQFNTWSQAAALFEDLRTFDSDNPDDLWGVVNIHDFLEDRINTAVNQTTPPSAQVISLANEIK
jgi:hypothetical protein